MQRRHSDFIPILFHNLKGFDGHFLVRALHKRREELGRLDVIAKSMESYIAIITSKFHFIDSLAHLNASLDELVFNLNGDPSAFSEIREFIETEHDGSEEKYQLLLRKAVFPYSYVTDMTVLEETELPPIEAFHDDLNDEPCPADEYRHAQRLWQVFELGSLGDLLELYVKLDVLLLDAVFKKYRAESLASYELDPLYYYTAPGLTFDAGLKYTKVELDLLTDQEMHLFFEDSIRGGISCITKRHARANNKYLSDSYDSTRPSEYLMYIDANNLYGWAMAQALPTGDFEWVEDLTLEDIMNYDPTSDVGYFVEVDAEIPSSLHNYLDDLPPFPETIEVTEDMASYHTRKLRKNRFGADHHYSCCQKKLAPNLHPKKKYKAHIAALQTYLALGGVVTKIWRALKFSQSSWLKPYIEYNTLKRQSATSPFAKRFYKLMVNSYFGKTMEVILVFLITYSSMFKV
jgi:hypothetical protein